MNKIEKEYFFVNTIIRQILNLQMKINQITIK